MKSIILLLPCALVAHALPATTVLRVSSESAQDANHELDHVASPGLETRQAVDKILKAATSTTKAWDRLALMTDLYGSRIDGSEALERSIDWIVATMQKEDKFDAVYTQEAKIPHWVRGKESLRLVSTPIQRDLQVLGLGSTIGTPAEGIEGSVVPILTFEELAQRAEEVRGKIVLFNAKYQGYGTNSKYRSRGPQEAAKYGAVAALVRSITPFSLATPHTGVTVDSPIPAAAVTLEDADLLARLYNRGLNPRVRLNLDDINLPEVISRNVIAEIKGWEFPDEIVVAGGHIDSWDVGSGAQDDGAGAFTAWEAIRVIAELGLRPRRTLRAAMWTDEEHGGGGADAYFKLTGGAEGAKKHILAIESDGGTFEPYGLGFTGSTRARLQLQEIAPLIAPVGGGNITSGGGGADIDDLCTAGVPCAAFVTKPADKCLDYFFYHHTNADTVSSIDPQAFARSAAAMAGWMYAVADSEVALNTL